MAAALPSILASPIRVIRSGLAELRHRPAHQLPALDALRSAAILMVVFHHWSIKNYRVAGGPDTPIQHLAPFYYGWAGVDLFFILSGFLIGKQLWRELERTGDIRFGNFILRRGLRIWPIYYVMLAFYALTSSEVVPRWPDWTFLSNYAGGGLARGWSLSTEEQFYIAIPLLLLALRKWVRLPRFLWVLLGLEVVVLANRYRHLQGILASGGSLEPPPVRTITPIHLHLEGLLAGLVIALIAVVWPKRLEPARGNGLSVAGLAVVAATTALALSLRAYNDVQFVFLVLALIFGGVTYWALRDRSFLSAPLRWPVWYPISRLSYSMYLSHWLVWPASNVAIVSFVKQLTNVPAAIFLGSLFLGTLLSMAIAVIMFVVVEHPFLLLRDHLLAPKGTGAHASAAPPHSPLPSAATPSTQA